MLLFIVMYDLIVVGGGPAGYSAALYAVRFKMKTLVLTEDKGGIIKWTNLIENYPGGGFVSGKELAEKMEEQAVKFGTEIKEEKVQGIEKKGSNFKVISGKGEYDSKSLILATGVKKRKLNIPGEEEFQNKGVSFCALCDGVLFKDKEIAVVGGGDSAAKEAILLTKYAKKVYIIYRGNRIHPEPIRHERVMEKVKEGKIEVINNTNITEIKGNKFVEHVILDKEYKGNKKLEVQGVFVEIGGTPGNDLARGLGVELTDKGFIKIDELCRTNVPGVFAAGDVTSFPLKQAITAAAYGTVAAYSAHNYLSPEK